MVYGISQFNMTGYPGLLQSGLSIFGGGYNNSVFTNCFGEPNYDAMAGYGVANALLGTLSQALSTRRAAKQTEKQEAVNNEERIKDINAEISTLLNTKAEDKVEPSYQTAIDNANKKNATLSSEILKLQGQISDAEKLENPDQTSLNNLKQTLEQKQAEQKVLDGDENTEGSIKNLEKAKADRIKEIQKEIDNKIAVLEKEKEELQQKVNDAALDKADGNKLQRTSAKKFNVKWNADNTAKSNAEFDKGDMKYAILGFRNAANDSEKKVWANKISTIYSYFQQNNQESITAEFKVALGIVKPYIG